MKITKNNYNELKKKELDNNYAKVWHVNEIREELLASSTTTKANYVAVGGEVDITTNAGKIEVDGTISSSILVNGDFVTQDSIILLTCDTGGTGDVVTTIQTVDNGFFGIYYSILDSTNDTIYIHYLII
jgi:hypothetical protein